MGKLRALRMSSAPMMDTRIAHRSPRTPVALYASAEWKALLASIIEKRGRRCERAGCGRSQCRIFGDHIVELKDGGAPLDERNVMLLCGACHTIKTHERKRARESRGVGPFRV